MTAVADLLADPGWYLHRIDPAGGAATFVPTRPDLLTRPSFIDGRDDFACGPAVTVSLGRLLEAPPPQAAGPERMIFHVSFCGSTLLARMLELPGAAFVLKEPAALVDLADWKKAAPGDARLAPALAMVRAALGRRWSADEPVMVKPSNWVNNLLPDLTRDPALRAVFVTMARRPFLVAILRGGRDRLAFTARAAAHLATTQEEQGWLRAAIAASDDPLARAVRLAAVTLHVQMRAFAAVAVPGRAIDAAAVTGDPVAAALMATQLLDLGIDPGRLAAHAAAKSGEDSKNPGRAFTTAGRRGEDDAVEQHHGALLDAAEDWAERTLGPHPRLS